LGLSHERIRADEYGPNIAHDWLLPVAAAEDGASPDDFAEASASTFFRMPRDVFEYQP
jgi:hypothetical protein